MPRQDGIARCSSRADQAEREAEALASAALDDRRAVHLGPPAVARNHAVGASALAAETRSFFEPRFGHDFSGVRVQSDGDASRQAIAIGARAFVVGETIVWGDSAQPNHPRARDGGGHRHLNRPDVFCAAASELLTRSVGKPLAPDERRGMQAIFGHDFSSVRIHADRAAAESADSMLAHAYTFGDHIVFGPGQYGSQAPGQQRLLAHELAHVVQQQQGGLEWTANYESEARSAERGNRPSLTALNPVRTKATSGRPFVQFQTNRAAIQARLHQVQVRLSELRAIHGQLSERFTSSLGEERERASVAGLTRRAQAQSRTESAARLLWGGRVTAQRILQAVRVSVSGTTATLTVPMQLAYLSLTDHDARQRAAIDIPRIESAIREIWQIDIASGDYAGVRFRLAPSVTWVPRTTAASLDAFLIQVRGPDSDPSSGDSARGVISLAVAHLQGSRVRVVAHELAHLFGFVDAYLEVTHHESGGSSVRQAAVGRPGAIDRPDLLGMIDPVVLERWRREGQITAEQSRRQAGPVHVWAEDASIVLRTLGVAPPGPPRPTPESEDFDPQVELEHLHRGGESRLSELRTRRARIENSLRSLEVAEQIIQLEREERDLRARLGSSR